MSRTKRSLTSPKQRSGRPSPSGKRDRRDPCAEVLLPSWADIFCPRVLTYIKSNRWFGAALVIAGFSEFIYWTSPTFIGATREFDKLLANKLALSVVSFLLLLAAIWLLGIFSAKDESQSGR